MLSLIITLVSIALVVALALATLYYGGDAMSSGGDTAKAARVIAQSQQLLGATDIFKVEQGRWPTSVPELVEKGYLKAVPTYETASAGVDAVAAAHAAEDAREWASLVPDAPAFWLLKTVSKEVCQKINLNSRGDDGIYKKAQPGALTQCFGESAPYTALAQRAGTASGSKTLETAVTETGQPNVGVAPDGGGWAVEPSGPGGSDPDTDAGDPGPIQIEVTEAGAPLTLGYNESGTLMRTTIGTPLTKTFTVKNVSSHPGAVHTRWRSYNYDSGTVYNHGLQQSSNCGVVMQPGGTCTLTVTYAPQEAHPSRRNGHNNYSWILFMPGTGSNNLPPTDDVNYEEPVLQVNQWAENAQEADLRVTIRMERRPGEYYGEVHRVTFTAFSGGLLDRLGSQQGNLQNVTIHGSGDELGLSAIEYAPRISGTTMAYDVDYSERYYTCSSGPNCIHEGYYNNPKRYCAKNGPCPTVSFENMGDVRLSLYAEYDNIGKGQLMNIVLPAQVTTTKEWCATFEFNPDRNDYSERNTWQGVQERLRSVSAGACS